MFTMEITRLIERCRQGDAEALGELYKAYAKKMKGVCRRYISDDHDINDVLHDAFVIIFTSFDKLRDDRKAEAWMMSITRNVASKYKDHLMTRPFVPLKEAEQLPMPENKAEVRGVPLEDVLRLIERLPEGYGQVFRLSVFDGLSHKEIANMLGIEPHSSSSQLARAKRMLRGMMQRYWALLLLLLIPITMYLFRKDEPVTKKEKPVVAEQKQTQEVEPTEQSQEPVIVHLPVHHPTFIEPIIAKTVDSIAPDTLSNMIVQEQTIPDTIKSKEKSDTTHIKHEIELPCYDIVNLQREKSRIQDDWHLAVAYAGNPQNDMSRTDNYMTMPTLSGSMTRSTKLYNWGDYMDYVMANAPMMDSVSASNMRHVAIINSNHPQDPLTETKHHERPLTLQLSLSRQLNSHWSLATGLSYTRMKSTFESGNENTIIYRTQRLHYLGIPLKLGYRVVGGNRWNLYTTGGVQLDIPVSARLTTQYIYGGSYAPIGNSPDIDATISAPWQWSVGVGIGAQYQIVPHLNVYLEPSLNYFIPTSTDVESYRTEHPFDLSLPFGIRFTW
jgi:RNA polymerase sigma-70 factor (ECF subfamily)